MNNTPIEAFDAEYRVKYIDGKVEWLPCTVVGVSVESRWDSGQFLILTEDEDGITYCGTADAVRRL